jgi:hypothetical protein
MRGCLHVTQRNRPQKKLLTQSPSIRSAAFSYHCPRTLVAHPSRASHVPFSAGGVTRRGEGHPPFPSQWTAVANSADEDVWSRTKAGSTSQWICRPCHKELGPSRVVGPGGQRSLQEEMMEAARSPRCLWSSVSARHRNRRSVACHSCESGHGNFLARGVCTASLE